MSETIAIETAEMQRREWLDTRPQDQLAERRKFACCQMCGSIDGMDSVYREALARLDIETITRLAPWYLEYAGGDYLFHACQRCNRRNVIPAGFVRMRGADIPAWLDRSADPMAPDYAALGRREPVSQITDSREGAGLEG